MLHDPSHYTPMPVAEEVRLTPRDREILRALASELAGIAALPVHTENARLWQKLNDLESERPMVWINEICWHEMNVDDELTLRTEDPWAQEQEREMRRTLYQWRHLPGDMIVSDYLTCPLAFHSPDFGIIEDVDIVTTDRPGENPHARGDAQPARHRTAVPGHVRPVRRHHACQEGRADAHLVHAVGLPHSLVGHRRGDARPERAPSPGPRGRGAHGGRLDGGTGPVRRPEPFVAGSRQHAHRVGRIRLHARITRTGFRSGVREAAQHVGMFERADLLGCIVSHALGVRRGARPSRAVALEAGVLRLLRAARPQDPYPASHPEPAEDFGQPLVQD